MEWNEGHRYVVEKLTKGQVLPSKNKKGKQGHQVKKYTEDEIENVKTFINIIPRY